MASLKTSVLQDASRKTRTERLIEQRLTKQELKELRDLFRDQTITLRSIHNALRTRKVAVSYSALYSLRQKVLQP